MAKHRYKCTSCEVVETKYTHNKDKIICTICGADSIRMMPILNGPPDTQETVDKYTGIMRRPDQQLEVKERNLEYYWSVEVPRLVNSGIYSIETMLENGWIWVDDKDQININTKPQHKR